MALHTSLTIQMGMLTQPEDQVMKIIFYLNIMSMYFLLTLFSITDIYIYNLLIISHLHANNQTKSFMEGILLVTSRVKNWFQTKRKILHSADENLCLFLTLIQ